MLQQEGAQATAPREARARVGGLIDPPRCKRRVEGRRGGKVRRKRRGRSQNSCRAGWIGLDETEDLALTEHAMQRPSAHSPGMEYR